MSSTRVNIYDQNYTIGGTDPATIVRLAEQVDSKMRQVASELRLSDALRVAVLTAVNLADENERLRARCEAQEQQVGERARALAADLDHLLERVG